jgi:enoyl-CoA hydratase/carnithine racemase
MAQPEAYEFATGVMAAAAISPESQEGIASFVEKRRPNY